MDIVTNERQRRHKDVLLVTLDVNSIRWDDMILSLEPDFRIPMYLGNVLKDCLWGQRLLYDTLDGRRQRVLSAGNAKGLVLGPDLWNAF